MLSDFFGGFLFGLAINLKRLRLHNKRASFPACLRNNENLTGDCVSIVTPSFFYEETINVSKDIFQMTGSIIDSTYKMIAPFYLIIVRGFHSTHLPLQSVGVSCLVRDSFFHQGGGRYTVFPQKVTVRPVRPYKMMLGRLSCFLCCMVPFCKKVGPWWIWGKNG